MEHEKARKKTFTRSEFANKEARKILAHSALVDALAFAVTGFSIPYTIHTCILFGRIRLWLWIIEILIALFLLVVAAFLITAAVRCNIPLFCLLFGKYTVATDRATQIEPRDRNGKATDPALAAWNCVTFENYGKAMLELALPIKQGEEYYLLIIETKKPDVLNIRPCSKYELIEEPVVKPTEVAEPTAPAEPATPEQATEPEKGE
ncbi:MAG: hypothetical protein IIU63_06185 [Clostridia bacterium]|nr:hypothetical protein [Clostridia bacterium]